MKNRFSTVFFPTLLILILTSCSEETKPIDPNAVFNEEFNWTISIPKQFEKLSAIEWNQIQNGGEEIIDTTDEQLAKTIVVFRNGDFNYFESNYQLYDSIVDGNYNASCQSLNEGMYENFKEQMPGMQIDSSSSIELIDELAFQNFKISINFPNGMTLNSNIYSRLFDDRELSVNIMYVDNKVGEEMLSVWRKSSFKPVESPNFFSKLLGLQLNPI